MQTPAISIIAAIGKNRELGKDNDLLWRIPDDLKRFRALTMGHPILMGRKTFGSIGKPLPGRTNIVVTRDINWTHENVAVFHSLEEALKHAASLDEKEIFIIGGAQIYEQALPYADRLYLTLIEAENPEAEIFFPVYQREFPKIKNEERREMSEGLRYTWRTLER